MRETTIKDHLRTKPFRPFRLHVSDGASYDIQDPDSIFVLTGRVILGSEPDEAGIPQKAIYIDPIHVTRITPINGGA
ncbi:MAG: hypothetical protein HY718_13520 [Planctomycetes bacterium]|nr:hypothetical protein [Planctomycetota bacterium]